MERNPLVGVEANPSRAGPDAGSCRRDRPDAGSGYVQDTCKKVVIAQLQPDHTGLDQKVIVHLIVSVLQSLRPDRDSLSCRFFCEFRGC